MGGPVVAGHGLTVKLYQADGITPLPLQGNTTIHSSSGAFSIDVGSYTGVVIAKQARHFVAVIDGVANDAWDCTERMVYGYWAKQ